MIKNFAAAIASAGRLYTNSTIQICLDELSGLCPVYVYADEHEAGAYAAAYPEAVVVPHDKKTIMGIRGFVQDHQHSLGNNYLTLDDDINGFYTALPDNPEKLYSRSIRDLAEETAGMFEQGFDYITIFHRASHLLNFFENSLYKDNPPNALLDKLYKPIKGGVLGIGLGLYNNGVRYSQSDWDFSEDTWMSVEAALAEYRGKIRAAELSYLFDCDDTIRSNFKMEFYSINCIASYMRWGRLLDFKADLYPFQGVNKKGLEIYAEEGVCYDEGTDGRIKYMAGYERARGLMQWEPGADAAAYERFRAHAGEICQCDIETALGIAPPPPEAAREKMRVRSVLLPELNWDEED